MKPISEINRLIQTVSSAADLLEPAAYEAVCDFVRQSQTGSGAFIDRAGRPDWYYSLFGFLICKAFNLKNELDRLRHFVLNSNRTGEEKLVDWSVWALLRYSFKPGFFFKMGITARLIIRWVKGSNNTDQVYLTFITLLILNHFWGGSRRLSNRTERLTSASMMNVHSPTSHLAAAACIRNRSGLDTSDLSTALMNRKHPAGGFVSFIGQGTADLLSTAVAAYALSQTGTGISPVAADGLNFVSDQFDRGAFLSGDGDMTRDLEYTFYGLLALSSYSQSLSILKK